MTATSRLYTLGCIYSRAFRSVPWGMPLKIIALAVALVACGGQAQPINACATPSRSVTCDEQDFYTFTLENDDGGHPTWTGSQCRTTPCVHGDACEVQISNGTFAEGVCE